MEIPDYPNGHLTYCSNIHPGESWDAVKTAVFEHVPEVKARIEPRRAFGVGLRLSGRAAAKLRTTPGELEAFSRGLKRRGLYVFTINGFPHGRFHGAPVKQDAYRPDWREPARLTYTEQLADILAALLPDGEMGTISTVPGGFGPDTADASAREKVADRLLQCAASLWRRGQATGTTIALALEPEPHCMFETTEDAVQFMEERLLTARAIDRMTQLTGLDSAGAELAIRVHVGLCIDTCHAAIEFEDPSTAVDRIVDAGLRLAKVQITTGLVADPVTDEAVTTLTSFDDDVYLHQVVARDEHGVLHRFVDLPDAIASRAHRGHRPEEWRVHFHVPVFQRQLSPLTNTWSFLSPLLTRVFERGACRHFEVETYTWNVLPERYRAMPLPQAIALELESALGLIHAASGAERSVVA